MFLNRKYFKNNCNLRKIKYTFDYCLNSFLGGTKSLKTSSHLCDAKDNINKYKDIFFNVLSKIEAPITPSIAKYMLTSFAHQFKLFYEEMTESDNDHVMYQKYVPGQIDMLFKLDTQDEIDNFIVSVDATYNQGYSSASFKLTETNTALFSGNICTTPPKDGETKFTGYANIMTRPRFMSFYRRKCFDLEYYTHIVLKVRGDGRRYRIALASPEGMDINLKQYFYHPLYTRGGPYWQITKIPLSHFYLGAEGRIMNYQYALPKNTITRFGISLRDSYDGPFKLEIDYVGLERDLFDRYVSPYERYSE